MKGVYVILKITYAKQQDERETPVEKRRTLKGLRRLNYLALHYWVGRTKALQQAYMLAKITPLTQRRSGAVTAPALPAWLRDSLPRRHKPALCISHTCSRTLPPGTADCGHRIQGCGLMKAGRESDKIATPLPFDQTAPLLCSAGRGGQRGPGWLISHSSLIWSGVERAWKHPRGLYGNQQMPWTGRGVKSQQLQLTSAQAGDARHLSHNCCPLTVHFKQGLLCILPYI